MTQFLSMIAGPLLNYLNQAVHGGDFAAWLADGYGDQAYLQPRGLGNETLLAALQSYPALWQQLEPFQVERVVRFVEEFVAGPREAEESGAPASSPTEAVES